MATVYSYRRVSSKKQEHGGGILRQTDMGQAWLKRHPQHTLDTTLRLKDFKSAFHGLNLDPKTGDLGKFLALVQQGKVEQGSILLIENLDRFSRQDAHTAYSIFGDLVKAGITVQTLSPETTIDDSNFNNMGVVIETVLTMVLAHEESAKKSQRIKARWQQWHEQAAKDGTAWSKRCPCWLYRDEDKWKVKDGAKRTIAYIFKRSCEGIGQARLLEELNAKHKPFGKSGQWRHNLLWRILNSRAVLGEATPQQRSGKPQPAIVGYYPQVIPDDLWYRARAAIEGRKHKGGRHAAFVNLFVGLVRFPDGTKGQIQTNTWATGTGRHLARRWVSAGYRDRVQGACRLAVEYFKVEKFVMAMLYQLKPSDLFGKSGKSDNGIKAQQQTLRGVELRLAELQAALGNSKQPVPQLMAAIADLNMKADTIKAEIDRLRQHEATADSKPLEAMKDILTTLAKKPPAEQHDLRLKLRGLVADIVEKVELEPYRNGHLPKGQRVEARITIFAKREISRHHLAVDTAKPLDEVQDIMAGFRPVVQQHEHLAHLTQEEKRLKKEIPGGKKELDKDEMRELEKELGKDKMRVLRRVLADKGV